jgi:hypothetical protein
MVKIAQSKTDLVAQWNAMGDNFMKKDPNFAEEVRKGVTNYENMAKMRMRHLIK